jgi:hypothetical protein
MLLSDTRRIDLIILLVRADKPDEDDMGPVLHSDDDAVLAALDVAI